MRYYKKSLTSLLYEKIDKNAKDMADNIQKDELHVFDFDDTIATTKDPVGVCIFRNNKPMFFKKSHKAVFEKYIKDYLGINYSNDLLSTELKGDENGLRWNDNLGSWTFYVTSSALADKIHSVAQSSSTNHNEVFLGTPSWDKLEMQGEDESWINNDFNTEDTNKENIVYALDFSLSAKTTVDKYIPKTLEKIKAVNSAGADTHVLTARAGVRGKLRPTENLGSFDGIKYKVSNEEDIENALDKKGTSTTIPPWGSTGSDKGKEILALVGDDMPEEIHFYDDADKNIKNVKKALQGKTNLFLYGGQGSFETNADAYEPDEFIPKDDKEVTESILNRWKILAGII